jgi:hypothetical protein
VGDDDDGCGCRAAIAGTMTREQARPGRLLFF